jgi:Mg2+-importing ATPase
LWSSVVLAGVTLALPYLPFIGAIGLVPLPLSLVLTILAVTALYVGATELLKVWFYRVRPVGVSP